MLHQETVTNRVRCVCSALLNEQCYIKNTTGNKTSTTVMSADRQRIAPCCHRQAAQFHWDETASAKDFHWSPSEILVWKPRTASQLICLAKSLHTARQTPAHMHTHTHTHLQYTITTSVVHAVSSRYSSKSAPFMDSIPLPYTIHLSLLNNLCRTLLLVSMPVELPVQRHIILLMLSL